MDSPGDVRVLIVGGGVAGLASAHALANLPNIRVTLIEANSEEQIYLAGLNLAMPPNGARALKELGYDLGSIVKDGSRLKSYELRTRENTSLSKASLEPFYIDSETPYFAIKRRRLVQALRRGPASPRENRLDMQFGVKMISSCIENESVKVVVESNGVNKTEHFDVVIAADGVHSPTRRSLINPDFDAKHIGQFAWRASVLWPDDEEAPEGQVVYSDDGKTITMIPQGSGYVYLYFAVISSAVVESDLEIASTVASRIEILQSLFSGFIGYPERALDLIAAQLSSDQIHGAPLYEVDIDRWFDTSGRVLVIGDAAHATSPSMAQGASQCLEDAIVLRDVFEQHVTVTEKNSGANFVSAFQQYEKRRRPRTDHVVLQCHRRDSIVKQKAKSKLTRWITNKIIVFKGVSKLQQQGLGPLLMDTP